VFLENFGGLSPSPRGRLDFFYQEKHLNSSQ